VKRFLDLAKRAGAAAVRWARSEPAVVAAVSTAIPTIWTAAVGGNLTKGIVLGALERSLVTPTVKLPPGPAA
jgi:hypothetical protein